MTAGLVRMQFTVPEVWIGLELVGYSFEMERDDHRVRVAFPDAPDSFSRLPDGLKDEWLPSLVPAGPVFNEPDRDVRTVGLILFEVTVELTTQVSSPRPAELTVELRDLVERDLAAGKAVAIQVADLVVRHLRASAPRQSWLGLAAHAPEQYGLASLENRETGEFIFGLGPTQSVTMRSSRLRLERDRIEAVASQVAANQEPSVSESLLADAWHLSDSQGANDQDRAWIVAAIACEVRVKQDLRERATPDKRAMVDLLLKRRSNLPELLDEVWVAVFGISWRIQDPALFKDLKTLTAQRNQIVHNGRRDRQLSESLRPVQVAQNLFDRLDEDGRDSTPREAPVAPTPQN